MDSNLIEHLCVPRRNGVGKVITISSCHGPSATAISQEEYRESKSNWTS